MLCELNSQTINSDKIILKQVKKNKCVIYGGRSLQKQLPFFLKNITNDYDIYCNQPRKQAHFLEHQLDERAGCPHAFHTRKARHPGTYKVVRNDGSNVADFSKTDPALTVINKGGVKYSSIEYERKKRLQILKDKQARWRHLKAEEDLALIRAKQFFENKRRK